MHSVIPGKDVCQGKGRICAGRAGLDNPKRKDSLGT